MTDPANGHPTTPATAARPAPVDHAPGTDLGRTLAVLDEIDRAGRRLGPVLQAVERLTGLTRAQLITAIATPDGVPPGRTEPLTDAHRATVEQVQGLRVRIVDTLLATLDDAEVADLHVSLRRVGDALEHLSTRTAGQWPPGTTPAS